MAGLTPLCGPSLICYDGSEGARRAVAAAAELLNAREAVVLVVWRPVDVSGGLSWAGASAGTINLAELNSAAEKEAVLLADEGVRVAVECGLDARPLTLMAGGPIWVGNLRGLRPRVGIRDRHGLAWSIGRQVDVDGQRFARRPSSAPATRP